MPVPALYSAGTDSLVKHFSPATGQVISKIAVPTSKSVPDPPTLLSALSPPDPPPGLRFGESTSGFSKQWVSTGGTTLAVTDLRRGVLVRSEDQEDELLCSTFIAGMGPKKNRDNGVLAVGTGSGVLTLWDRGSWDDQFDRVIVDSARGGGESLDCIVQIPEDRSRDKKVAIGLGDGSLRLVNLTRRELEVTLRHDDLEAVVSLGFDCEGRMISGGGQTIKIWQDSTLGSSMDVDSEEDSEEDSDDDDDGDDDDDADLAASSGAVPDKGNSKRQTNKGSDSEDSDSDDGQKRKKKRKKGKGKVELGPHGAHGILKFKGLD
ncbi:hypothetical protein CIB48_g5788 [Xylaria polymorpha]|nr:hypothetical protein CIB48_g5788 [Xylaria polymorpha]